MLRRVGAHCHGEDFNTDSGNEHSWRLTQDRRVVCEDVGMQLTGGKQSTEGLMVDVELIMTKHVEETIAKGVAKAIARHGDHGVRCTTFAPNVFCCVL